MPGLVYHFLPFVKRPKKCNRKLPTKLKRYNVEEYGNRPKGKGPLYTNYGGRLQRVKRLKGADKKCVYDNATTHYFGEWGFWSGLEAVREYWMPCWKEIWGLKDLIYNLKFGCDNTVYHLARYCFDPDKRDDFIGFDAICNTGWSYLDDLYRILREDEGLSAMYGMTVFPLFIIWLLQSWEFLHMPVTMAPSGLKWLLFYGIQITTIFWATHAVVLVLASYGQLSIMFNVILAFEEFLERNQLTEVVFLLVMNMFAAGETYRFVQGRSKFLEPVVYLFVWYHSVRWVQRFQQLEPVKLDEDGRPQRIYGYKQKPLRSSRISMKGKDYKPYDTGFTHKSAYHGYFYDPTRANAYNNAKGATEMTNNAKMTPLKSNETKLDKNTLEKLKDAKRRLDLPITTQPNESVQRPYSSTSDDTSLSIDDEHVKVTYDRYRDVDRGRSRKKLKDAFQRRVDGKISSPKSSNKVLKKKRLSEFVQSLKKH